jgi:hypothetical protein
VRIFLLVAFTLHLGAATRQVLRPAKPALAAPDDPRLSKLPLSLRDDDRAILEEPDEDKHANTSEPEPTPEPKGENPWADLWFYSNAVSIEFR